ncbi:hypothetical protein [Microbacterium aerolatum]|uniref:hypothetical protein n=1 Tax=Microbacterium aerolatum TaxID=153731 RepID=UPI00384C0936
MTMSRVAGTALAIAATLMLTGCFGDTAPDEQEPASIVMTIDELQGSEVQLSVGETLGVDTLGQDSSVYDAMILDASVAAYEPSRDGSQIRIEAVAAGTTDVLLADPDESVDEISFTLTVEK